MDTGEAATPRNMIIVDSSIWIDHFHKPDPLLAALLIRDHALMHPHALGEISLGSVKQRRAVLALFELLPVPVVAKEAHLRHMIEQHQLAATGIGYTDAHLLASALLTPGGQLWTRDKRLRTQAERLGAASHL